MSGQGNEEMGFQQHREGGFINCPSSGMGTNSFFGSGWDPLVSLAQNETFGGSSALVSQSQAEFCNPNYNPNVMESQGMSSVTSHVVQYPSDSSYAELVPKLPGFGSGSFSDMVGSYGYPQIAEIANPPNYALSKEKGNERSSAINSQDSDGKRRKRAPDSNSPISSDKNCEGEKQKNLSAEFPEDHKEQDEKKPKMEENSSANMRRKETGKHAKETSNSEENAKDNYIHVRARRGQATNSHSLAERVRREKISERMRLLQELVPGCNKITGKAVMLDEIINYVQSLQQQVEFLSMKLATVNPELNIDLERLLSKDILNSRGGNAALFGLSPSIGASHHYPHGMFQGAMPSLPTSIPQFASLSQAVLDPELQGLFHIGFDSNSGIDNLGPNGRLKPEL